MVNHLLTFLTATSIAGSTLTSGYLGSGHMLSSHTISLEQRYNNKFVNDVFKDNILLNLAYMDGRVKNKSDINWEEIKKPAIYQFVLKPQETFSFHEDVLPQYKSSTKLTTNSHFNFDDGFKTDGFLYGDGVCHFASLLFWAAKDAGIQAEAPTNHNFMPIPQVPKEYGVSIYSPKAQQNLYITNNKNSEINFKIIYDGENLSAEIFEAE